MKNLKLLILLTIAIFWVGSCSKSKEFNPELVLGESFEITIEKTAFNSDEDLRFRVIEVLEDSRCPIDVNCVWQGQIKILAEIKINGEGELKELTFVEGKENILSYKDFQFEILEVKPDTQLDETIAPEEYFFSVLINKM